jgi:ketosteroid isomerase-like protein
MNRYVIYNNDNGTDRYQLGDSDEPEDEYRRLLRDHNDDYFETSAFYIRIENNKVADVWEIFLPELDEEAMEF